MLAGESASSDDTSVYCSGLLAAVLCELRTEGPGWDASCTSTRTLILVR